MSDPFPSNPPVPGRRALILIDHGSRAAEANALLERVADLVRARALGGDDFAVVQIAHMELAPPDLHEAFDRCAAAGASEIVVVPYFLAPGRHASEDIPRMAREAAAAHPGIAWRLAAPLGLDDRMADLVLTRALEATRSEASDPS